MLSTPNTSKPSTMAASLAFFCGRIKEVKPSSLALIAIGKAPFIGCTLPSKDNSPMIIYCAKSVKAICLEAAKMPMARVKS